MKLHMIIAVLAAIFLAAPPTFADMLQSDAGAAAERECDEASLDKLDYYECESQRLRRKAARLAAEARTQMSQGESLSAKCETLEDQTQFGNCDLLSSDLFVDAGFKQAEAMDLMDEAERMAARAADLQQSRHD